MTKLVRDAEALTFIYTVNEQRLDISCLPLLSCAGDSTPVTRFKAIKMKERGTLLVLDLFFSFSRMEKKNPDIRAMAELFYWSTMFLAPLLISRFTWH